MERKELSKISSEWKINLSSAVLLILTAQLNINLLINGFKISLAIIVLPLLTFLIDEFKVLPVTVLAAPGVLLVRSIMELFHGGSLVPALESYAPEMIFFLLYGGMFAFYTHFVDFTAYHIKLFVPLIGIDFLSNLGEMQIRVGTGAYKWPILSSLLVVAFGRTLLSAVLLGALDTYGLFLLKKDDRERYKKLLLLIAQLKGEVVWMDKNTIRIEDTMAVSYGLYHDLNEAGEEKAAQKALTVAKDVHEIKKEYYLIMRGITNALELDMEEKGMWIKSIFQILLDSLNLEIHNSGRAVRLSVNAGRNFYTDKHYFLMSVFRNLMTNAVEAAGENAARVSLTEKEDGEAYLFQVHDDCGGIPAEYMESLFLPGFSTKISYETGEVSRGLGLALVRDIVEDKLGGSLTVESSGGCTDFWIRIPKTNLEVPTK